MYKNNPECLCVHAYVQREAFKNKKGLLMENYFIFSKGRPFLWNIFLLQIYKNFIYVLTSVRFRRILYIKFIYINILHIFWEVA